MVVMGIINGSRGGPWPLNHVHGSQSLVGIGRDRMGRYYYLPWLMSTSSTWQSLYEIKSLR